MRPEERRKHIMHMTRSSPFLSIAFLSTRFGVSEMTIRRDLDWLQDMGKLQRVRGGAVLSESQLAEPSYAEKEQAAVERKSAVARLAAQMVKPGDSLLLTTGTTVRLLAQQISDVQGLTVVTNGVDIAFELAASEGIRTMILGGSVRKSYAIVGLEAEKDLSAVHYVDTLFMGVDGISHSHGLTCHHPMEARLYAQMMAVAASVVVVADSTKVGRPTFSYIGPIAEANILVTNRDADSEECQKLEARGLVIEKAPAFVEADDA